jgi:hypothetical protein
MLLLATLICLLWTSPPVGIVALIWVAVLAARNADDAMEDDQYTNERDDHE